jgi:hypothetical protein
MLQILAADENTPAATALMQQHLNTVEVAHPEAFKAAKLKDEPMNNVLTAYWETKQKTDDDAEYEG